MKHLSRALLVGIGAASLSGCTAIQSTIDILALAVLQGLYYLIYPLAGVLVIIAFLSIITYLVGYVVPDWIPFRSQTVGRGFMMRITVAVITLAIAITMVTGLRGYIGTQIAQIGYRIEQGSPGINPNPTNPNPTNPNPINPNTNTGSTQTGT